MNLPACFALPPIASLKLTGGRRASMAGLLGYTQTEETRARAYWARVRAQAGVRGDGLRYAEAADAYDKAGYSEGARLLRRIAKERNKGKPLHVNVASDGIHTEDTRIVFNVRVLFKPTPEAEPLPVPMVDE